MRFQQILPHDITFYDLIATKARGKSGPLFHFDVHEDVRLGPIDTRIEKDGKSISYAETCVVRLFVRSKLKRPPSCLSQNHIQEKLSKDVGTSAINTFSQLLDGSYMILQKNTVNTPFAVAKGTRRNETSCSDFPN